MCWLFQKLATKVCVDGFEAVYFTPTLHHDPKRSPLERTISTVHRGTFEVYLVPVKTDLLEEHQSWFPIFLLQKEK